MWPEFWPFLGDAREFAAPFECAGTVVMGENLNLWCFIHTSVECIISQ